MTKGMEDCRIGEQKVRLGGEETLEETEWCRGVGQGLMLRIGPSQMFLKMHPKIYTQ